MFPFRLGIFVLGRAFPHPSFFFSVLGFPFFFSLRWVRPNVDERFSYGPLLTANIFLPLLFIYGLFLMVLRRT